MGRCICMLSCTRRRGLRREIKKCPQLYTGDELIMAESHNNSRLEAFCDGVFAIALTILIFDIRIPASEIINTSNDLWLAIEHLLPSLFAFLLSFIVIFITWV